MSNEYAEIAGLLEGALTGIDVMAEGVLYHATRARDAYALRHGNENAEVSSHLGWLLDDLHRLGAYVDDVTARAKAIHPEAEAAAATGYVGRHRRG